MPEKNETIKEKFDKRLQENIDNIYLIWKENNWTWQYDKDTDVLFLSNRERGFSEESISIPTKDDYLSIQINRKGDIEGIIIEEFVNLFVPENPEYEEFAKKLQNKKCSEGSLNKESYFKLVAKAFARDLNQKYEILKCNSVIAG